MGFFSSIGDFFKGAIKKVAPIAGSILGGPFGGIAGGLIGKAIGGGGGGGTPQTFTTPSMDPLQQEMMQKYAAYLRERIGQGMEPYGGQTVAGLDPLEQRGMGVIAGAPTTSAAMPYILEALKGISPKVAEERFRSTELPGMQRIFKEEVLPTIEESFVGPGTFRSTGRQRGVTEAASRFGETTAGALAETIRRGREAGLAAAPLAFQAEATPLRAGEAMLRAGGVGRGIEQRGLDIAMQQFEQSRPELSPVMEQLRAFLGMTTQAGGYLPGQPSPWAKVGAEVAPEVGEWLKRKNWLA